MTWNGDKRSLKVLSRALLEQSNKSVTSPHLALSSGGSEYTLRSHFAKRYSTTSSDTALTSTTTCSLSRPGSAASNRSAGSRVALLKQQRDRSAPNSNLNLRRASTAGSADCGTYLVSSTTTKPRADSTEENNKSEDSDDGKEAMTSSSQNLLPTKQHNNGSRPSSEQSMRSHGRLNQFTAETSTFALYKVLEYLHCGTIETACNDQLLCRQRIGYLLNASGTDISGMLATSRRNSLPCMCRNRNAHTRNEMALDLKSNSSPQIIVGCFETVNKFIQSARKQGRQVLIFSESGRDGAQALAIQYIMSYYNMTMTKGMQYVIGCAPVKIADNYMAALRLWEQKLKQAADKERQQALGPFLSKH